MIKEPTPSEILDVLAAAKFHLAKAVRDAEPRDEALEGVLEMLKDVYSRMQAAHYPTKD